MSKETFMKKLILFTFVTLLLASCSRSKNHTNGEEYLYDTIRVFSVDKMVETRGTANNIDTEIYYLVSCDKGAYRIDVSGIWANPQLVGVIKPNGIYVVKTAMFNAPIIKQYKRITRLMEEL
jgi:hypothetical protein